MNYLESLNIPVADERYEAYLVLRNWPRTFGVYLKDKKKELLSRKDEMYAQMSNEVNDILSQIKSFKKSIGVFVK